MSVVGRSIVERRKRIQNDGKYSRSIVLLDADRHDADQRKGRVPRDLPQDLNLVWLRPNLEGLLLRLHSGYETREIQGAKAIAELRRVWPNYTKGVSAVELNDRFGIDDLRRLARHDNQVQLLLKLIFLASN